MNPSPLLLFSLLLTIHTILVEKKARQEIQVEVGVAYQQDIPTVFHDFQYTTLLQFKKT